jgi:hypothetical protein
MADTTTTRPQPKRRTWLRVLLWGAGSLVGLLIVAYLVVTSGAFFKGFVLPRVSRAAGAEVTVAGASISPFSQVVLRDLKVQAPGQEPVLTAGELRARYSLRDILGGNLKVDEVALISPVIQVINNADGTSNIDPFVKKPAPSPAPGQSSGPASAPPQPVPPTTPQPAPGPAARPPQVDFKKVVLENATVRLITRSKEGGRDSRELTHLRVTLDNVKNGQTGKLTLVSDLALETVPPPGTNATLQAKLAGAFDVALTADLQPQSVKGSTRLTVDKAAGGFAQAAGLAATFDCELTPTELKELALRVLKGNVELGLLRISGPFDAKKQEGRLRLELQKIDRNVLNLAAGATGLDFGETRISSQSDIEITKAGASLNLTGQVTVAKLSITQPGVTTPPVDLSLTYAVAVDQARKTARVQALKLGGTQTQRPLLDVSLSGPMTVVWGNTQTSDAVGDAAVLATVSGFNLADWKALLGDVAGTLNATLKLDSRKAGQEVGFALDTQINDLAGTFASNRVSDLGVHLNTRGAVTNLHFVALPELLLEVKRRAELALKLTGSGQLDQASTNGDLQLTLQGSLPQLLALAAQPELAASSGTLAMNSKISLRPQAQTVSGNLALKSFNGRYSEYNLRNLEGVVDFDLAQQGPKLDLRQVRLALPPTARAKNAVQLTGHVDTAQSNAITGVLKLQADSIDLTPYYDMVATNAPAPKPPATGQGPKTARTGAPSVPGPPSAATNAPPGVPGGAQERAPVILRLKNFTVDAAVGRCYLREIEITNLLASVKLDAGQMAVRPAELALNGALVKADVDLDLSVPGYKYAVDFRAKEIPLAPLVNSFQPERKGVVGGTATALLELKGAGVTEASLQKTLSGQFDLSTTNLDLALENARIPVLDSVIRTVRELPDLLTKLPAGLGGVVGSALGSRGQIITDWTNALAQSPIDSIVARASAGAGKVEFQRALVQCPMFLTEMAGTITLAPVLTNSAVDMPVQLSLKRSLAEKVKLLAPGTPTNAPYVALRPFLTVRGTVGENKREIDSKALLTMLAESATALPALKGMPAGDLLKNLSRGLGGARSTNASTTTNQPATNKPAFSPFGLIPKSKK